MGFKTNTCARIFLIIVVFATSTSFIAESTTSKTPEDIIAIHNGTISIESQGSKLKEIVDRLRQDYAIEINGVDHKNDTPVTFSHTSDSLEGLLKALLRHLGEKNYAFEFIDQKLRRISVFPGVQKTKIPQITEERTTKSGPQFVTVAEVQGVVEGSQADSLGLIPGDVIFEYDGVKIHNALQLVKEVGNKSLLTKIEMVIMRDNKSMGFTLSGGFLGVRIQTKQISRKD